jgi:hypothetical protein
MASSAPNREVAARAAAILTTGEVQATALDLNETFSSILTVHISFTLGSLTNCTFRFYVSEDGVTYVPVKTLGGGVTELVLTGSNEVVESFSAPGWKWFRVSAQGSGTVTSSSATITYRYLRRATQLHGA